MDDDAATKAPGEAPSGGNGEALAGEREREEDEAPTGTEAHQSATQLKAARTGTLKWTEPNPVIAGHTIGNGRHR